MEIFFFWLAASIIVGIIAGSKGRTGFGYFVLSLLLTPVLIGILVLALPRVAAPTVVAGGAAVTPDTHVRCPDCRELVRADARKCKHCGTALVPQSLPGAPPGSRTVDIEVPWGSKSSK